jgi:hypothetical protein
MKLHVTLKETSHTKIEAFIKIFIIDSHSAQTRRILTARLPDEHEWNDYLLSGNNEIFPANLSCNAKYKMLKDIRYKLVSIISVITFSFVYDIRALACGYKKITFRLLYYILSHSYINVLNFLIHNLILQFQYTYLCI